jgi:ABC-type molybdate transport system substrate-binding protein
MSKLIKIAAILAVAAVAIAAKQFASPATDTAALSVAPASSISPLELMHHTGPLPESKVDSYF